MVLIQSWPPHLALAPIAQIEPPLMPFRDAGYATSDFALSVQDIVYGVWKAKENKLLDLKTFNLEEYELYERVDQGDFNEIPPHFIAFASPQQIDYVSPLNYPFCQILDYFETSNVQLVVRLNSELYNKAEFEKRGIRHMDLIFEDGTCPTMLFVQAFIGAVECVIAQKGKVAVHCKAGLGRTGCLIGAHLIYTYGFTAQEVIGYMRFLRPGMVVGPQQHWLYLHQHEFREWRHTMTLSKIADDSLGGFCPLVPIASEEARSRSPLFQNNSPPRTPERSILGEVDHTNTSALPVPTPGQPRKNSPSPHSSFRNVSTPYQKKSIFSDTKENNEQTQTKGITATRSFSQNSDDEDESMSNDVAQIVFDRSPKRNITDGLTQKQQLVMARQIRTTSNPSLLKTLSPSYRSTTMTTTTTTLATISSSPPTAGIDTAPLRRSTRVTSTSSTKAIRKVSASTRRK